MHRHLLRSHWRCCCARIGRLQCGRLRAAITAGWRAALARLLHLDLRSRHVGDEFRILVQSLDHGLADACDRHRRRSGSARGRPRGSARTRRRGRARQRHAPAATRRTLRPRRSRVTRGPDGYDALPRSSCSSSGTQVGSPVISNGRSRLYFCFALAVDCPASMITRCSSAYRRGVVACRHVDADCAREHVGGLGKFEVGIPRRQLPTRGVLQRAQLAIDGLVGGELGRARCGRWRDQRDAVGPFLGQQVARASSRRPRPTSPPGAPDADGTTSRQPTNQASSPARRAASSRAQSWMGCSWRQCNGRCGFAKTAQHESQPLHLKCAFPALSRCANVRAVTR